MKGHFSLTQKIVLVVWITAVILILSVYYLDPGFFDLSRLDEFAGRYYIPALLLYFILLSLRGLTLLPSTPVLIAGILIFEPFTVFFVNIAGFLVSATLVYRYSGYLRAGDYFENKYPKEIAWIRNLFRKREIPVIAGWSVSARSPTQI